MTGVPCLALTGLGSTPTGSRASPHMEAAPYCTPMTWDDFPDEAGERHLRGRSAQTAGDDMVLRDNHVHVEAFLIDAEKANLSEADKAEYRRPFLNAGEDRRPMLSFPRQIPLDGSQPQVLEIELASSEWLTTSTIPKLWVRADPGFITVGRQAAFCEALPNQTEVRVAGGHFPQESSGPEVGRAVANFVRQLRG